MVERRIFLDTSGLFAWMNAKDPHHQLMLSLPRASGTKLVVTDYVIDETCALFLARKIGHRRADLFGLLKRSRIVGLEWVERSDFWEAWDWMLKYDDQPFSFTDCTSFVIMRRLGISEVATNDSHFRTAGFRPLFDEIV